MSELEKQDLRSDEDLFRSWLKGDSQSFEDLLKRYQGRLYKVIFGWTRNQQLSQDLFQETWFRVIEHKKDFDPKRKFSSWVFQIALNLTRDHWRKEKRAQTDPDSERIELSASETNLEQALIEREQMERLKNALSGLSRIESEVFMLRHFGEMSFQQIAEALGVNLNTALSRMHQACSKLKKLAGEN